MDNIPKFAKQEILDLALQEAIRKLGETQDKINLLKDIAKDYQIIINNIRDWQGELE